MSPHPCRYFGRRRLRRIHRTDNDLQALLGESAPDAAVRETKEGTDLVGIYTNPAHIMAYDDGKVRQQFSICFRARIIGGELRTSS